MTLSHTSTPGRIHLHEAMTTTGPIPVHADWTTRQRTRLTGILMFTVTPARDTELTNRGREPQFHITGSTRTEKVTAFNDYGDEPFNTTGPLTEVATAAAEWLGITTPLDLHTHREYERH